MTVLKAKCNLQRGETLTIESEDFHGDIISRSHLNQRGEKGFPIGTHFKLTTTTENWLLLLSPTGEEVCASQEEMESGVLVEIETEGDKELGCGQVLDPTSGLMYSPEIEDIHGRPTNRTVDHANT